MRYVPVSDKRVQKAIKKANKVLVKAARRAAKELSKIYWIVDDPAARDDEIDKIVSNVIRELEKTGYLFNTAALYGVLSNLDRTLHNGRVVVK
jgi:predicted transcriptional regulator